MAEFGQLDGDPEYHPIAGPLYHYTSIDALLGIVSTKSLWATSVHYLNDASESELGISLIRTAAESAAAGTSGVDKEFLAYFLGWLNHSFVTYSSVYVLCFSEAQNQLSQWRGYAPVNGGLKAETGTALTKPIDTVVGDAIVAWEKVRPPQPRADDIKTAESVEFLFSFRARRLPHAYLNQRLIPILCRKAGIPRSDARGNISSHRARSTIASQLFNAKEPMTLFELQAWLGHRSPVTTQHYVAFTPTRLASAYTEAHYFQRNLRMMDVLIDQEAIRSGAIDVPWRYYDLGHGLCSYEFFDQCPHRMACARCDFYVPKQSSQADLITSKVGMLRMLQEIPLTDDERAAVDGDVAAIDRLLKRLETTPTPDKTECRSCEKCPTNKSL